ncbi:MAG: hypothetical protein ACQEV6_03245 [Pseudomonadota bacterium]
MHSKRYKYIGWIALLAIVQVASLLSYLNANIVNVGGMGTSLPLLFTYIGFSVFLIGFLWLQDHLYIRPHFFIFLLLIAWIAFRILVDLGDLEYLKQITIATTGGMLLFYVVGCFLSVTFNSEMVSSNKLQLGKLVLVMFNCLLVWMLYNFFQRLHPQLFYLTGIEGAYQRAGNFLSISFISVSFFYLLFSSKRAGVRASSLNGGFWLVFYTMSAFMALVGSQLFGSNSATAVILGVYLITIVMALLVPRKRLWLFYLERNLALPWSAQFAKRLFILAFLGFFIFIAVLVLVVVVTGFDITSIRLLGFGSGSNTSLLSRLEILMDHGASQLGYAPLFGNINVAYLTTGHAGRTLHTFFPYVIANLGLVGFFIVLALFIAVFMQLYKNSKQSIDHDILSYRRNMVSIYSMFIFMYIVLFANMAVGVSWPVLWFAIGFVSKPFGFRESD